MPTEINCKHKAPGREPDVVCEMHSAHVHCACAVVESSIRRSASPTVNIYPPKQCPMFPTVGIAPRAEKFGGGGVTAREARIEKYLTTTRNISVFEILHAAVFRKATFIIIFIFAIWLTKYNLEIQQK